MGEMFSRRDFLKVLGTSIAGALFPAPALDILMPPTRRSPATLTGRVARRWVEVRSEPDPKSQRLEKLPRDTLLPLLEEIIVRDPDQRNPRWYQLDQGFVHSAYIQRVEDAHLNRPLSAVPEGGLLGEVTMPYTQTRYTSRKGIEMPLYRLYYGSVHWITGLVAGPDGQPWYRLSDERLRIQYDAPARHLRPIPPEEFAPIATDIPAQDKWIEVSIEEQRLTAYQGRQAVFQAQVSTGQRYMETPAGEFAVNRKCPSKHMGDGGITANPEAYELLGVPWTTFFHTNGVAFHGTFWHDNFGTPMSQGCVNMRNQDALWLFRWCAPEYDAGVGYRQGRKLVAPGTRIVVLGGIGAG
ncbi:MAG: L,D-transpeptidase family protein [Anaerolineales bacterium]